MIQFLPGDRVRYRTRIGTVVPHAPEDTDLDQLTRVNMDDPVIPNGLYFVTRTLRLAGTRCLPDWAMTNQQLRDHLVIAHRWPAAAIASRSQGDSEEAHAHLVWLHTIADQAAALLPESPYVLANPIPHTHRKEPRP